jgi:hypothetical protein
MYWWQWLLAIVAVVCVKGVLDDLLKIHKLERRIKALEDRLDGKNPD